jgi:hypothetical protein
MARMKRARRAARHDPRYSGLKHDAGTHARRLAAKVDRENRLRARKAKKTANAG